MKHIAKVFVALTVASLLLIGPGALAARTSRPSSSWRPTRPRSSKGGKVKFTITLKSQEQKCRAGQPIRWYRNGVSRRPTRPTTRASRQFNKGVKATSKYFAKYPGNKVGTHPNRLNCQPSTSNTIRIKVKPGS